MANILENMVLNISNHIVGNKNYTAEQWVQWLLMKVRAENNIKFKERIRKLIDYYEGRQLEYLEDILKKQFVDYEHLKLQPRFVNITKQIIDTVAVTYKWGAQRELYNNKKKVSDKENALWQYIYESTKWERYMRVVDKYVKLLGTTFLRPYFNTDDNKLALDLVTPDEIDIIQHPQDPTKYIAVLYARIATDTYLIRVGEYKTNLQYIYHYWDAENYRQFLVDGTILRIEGNEEGINPYGVLPFVRFMDTMPLQGVFVDRGEDLLNAQENINVKLTQLNYLIKMQSFSIPILIGYNPTSDEEIVLHPGRPYVLPPTAKDETQPDLQFRTPSPQINTLMEQIEKEITAIARVYGISESEFRLTGSPSSGFALKMENLKLIEQRENALPYYEDAEEELFEVVKKVWNYHSDYLPSGHEFKGVKFDDNTKLKVTINPPIFPESPDEERSRWDWLFANKMATPVEYYMRYKGMTEEEAQKYWEKIKKWWDENEGGFGTKYKKEPPLKFPEEENPEE
ncbi:MAG: hypothetical protein DRI01_00650 [Chloroflexi bacterium]|nr:MAG: hypothetical protein DRI01_00650 [Chloroflexota bacterium]